MENGAILLLDEIDRATNKIMCLQGILEGKPVLVKKTGETISPAPGFTVIATANTKGKGSEDGRFTAASIIDDAFLERFTVAVDQQFPSVSVEKKIVLNHMKKFEAVDESFAENLVTWADIIRKTFYDDGVDEVISTRRLCHIVQTFSIFNDKMKSLDLCIARFDDDTKTAFLDLYTKVDQGVILNEETSDEVTI
jgi:MoxR-like ATPase